MRGQGSTTGRTPNLEGYLSDDVSEDGEQTHPAYTSVENLGRYTWWGIYCQTDSHETLESAVIWCYLAFRLRR